MSHSFFTVDLGALGEHEAEVVYAYYPGQPERGVFGPPENYDPGYGADAEIESARVTLANGVILDLVELDCIAGIYDTILETEGDT